MRMKSLFVLIPLLAAQSAFADLELLHIRCTDRNNSSGAPRLEMMDLSPMQTPEVSVFQNSMMNTPAFMKTKAVEVRSSERLSTAGVAVLITDLKLQNGFAIRMEGPLLNISATLLSPNGSPVLSFEKCVRQVYRR